MYDTFECHFKPNQKLQSDMTDPVIKKLHYLSTNRFDQNCANFS